MPNRVQSAKKANQARRRAAAAARRATAAGATSADTSPPQPHARIVDCSTGETREATLPTENALSLRNQELIDFADTCKGKTGAWLAENVGCATNREGGIDTYSRRHLEAFAKVLLAGMEVNGEDGNWSCGFLGSRWCDFRCNVGDGKGQQYGGRMVRYAYYGPDENRSGKPFILQMWGYFYEDA